MKILLTGKTGQIGYELERSLRGRSELVALDRRQMDLTNMRQMREVIRTVKPNLIINAAAYTAVDRAESEPELAMRINGDAPAIMAEEAKKLGAVMIHYSTDYVFDGTKASPYMEDDVPNPINRYGETKLAGERAVAGIGIPHLILRTSWVYGLRGTNFLTTILRLAKEGRELRVVDDQYGAPTWSRTVAEATVSVVMQNLNSEHADGDWWRQFAGTYHVCCQGQTNWYGFANTILDKMLKGKQPNLIAITSEKYRAGSAKRPLYTVMRGDLWLSNFSHMPTWTYALDLCLYPACSKLDMGSD